MINEEQRSYIRNSVDEIREMYLEELQNRKIIETQLHKCVRKVSEAKRLLFRTQKYTKEDVDLYADIDEFIKYPQLR